jgi:hypothetical protein
LTLPCSTSFHRKAIVTSPDGTVFEISPEVLTFERKIIKQSGRLIEGFLRNGLIYHRFPVREFIPNVIEPSFGMGRILYTLLEHSFWCREQDVERGVLSLPPVVAPTKVLIVPLSARDEFDPLVREICKYMNYLFYLITSDVSALHPAIHASLDQLPSCVKQGCSRVLMIPTLQLGSAMLAMMSLGHHMG